MSRFFVGQRVRVKYVYQDENSHLVGREGRIVEFQQFDNRSGYGLDIAPIEWSEEANGYFAWGEWQLEPILTEGHQPAELDVYELLPFLKEQVTA